MNHGFLIGMIALGLFTATPGKADLNKAKAGAPWAAKMRDLERTYSDLLVFLSSDDQFRAPNNRKKIEAKADLLAQLARDLKSPKGKSTDQDPSIALIAEQFATETKDAAAALGFGQREYARSVLRSLSNYCLACHTRTNSGPSFPAATVNPQIEALKTLEKADYLAAIRQFDRALTEYDRLLSDPSSLDHRPFDWERALRSSLAIAVRVKKDPERAMNTVERVLANAKTPFYLKEQALQWKQSLAAWKAEPSAQPATEEGFHALAVRLLTEARSLQKYPADRSADILYLRASSAAHDLMSFAPKGDYAVDALYLAGLSYEVLSDLNLGDLHEFYYLECIQRAPHSDKGTQCFKNYQESVHRGYTGSGGTHIPSSVQEKLKRLELLARPQAGGIQ